MRKNLVLAAGLVVSIAGAALAQSVAGKWTGEQQGRGGTQAVTLEVKADGAKLTGTLLAGENKSEIQEGMIEGAKVMFKTVQDFGGNSITIQYTGELKGDELTLTREFQGGRFGGGAGGGGGGGVGGGRGGGRGPQPLVLKRAS